MFGGHGLWGGVLMKRHNLLLFSFILFGIICLVVRSRSEFETWSYVVSAVAVSSAFLAYADFFYVQSKFFSDCCEIAEKFISDRCRKIEKEKIVAETICEQIAELKGKGLDVAQEEANVQTAKRGCLELEKALLDIKGTFALKRRKQKTFSFVADMLTILAFLCFLCLITFTNIARALAPAQDVISVVAFVVVLSSQYVGALYGEKYKKEIERHDHAVAAHDAVHEHVSEVQNKFNIYYEMMKAYAD